MNKQITIIQNTKQILNIIYALEFYKDNAIKPIYKEIIEKQMEEIGQQLGEQNISVLSKERKPLFNFGQEVTYEGKKAIITGMCDGNEFIKIAVINDKNELEQIDVPIILIDRD